MSFAPHVTARRLGAAAFTASLLHTAIAHAITVAADTTGPTHAAVRSEPLHLEDAIALAKRRDWDLLSAGAAAGIADAGIHTARQHPNPSVSLATTGIHDDGQGDGTSAGNDFWSRNYDSIVQLGQLVEVGGKRTLRRHAAAAVADGAHARLEDARRTLESTVTRAYVAAALAEADVRIARESAGYLRDEARIAEVRWKAGDISRSDLDQIEIAAARRELDARVAETAALAQRVALETLLGLPEPSGDITVADTLEDLVDRVGGPASAASGGVRPDLAAAQAELRRADAAWRLERAQRLPDPELLVQFEHQPPVRPNTIGFGLALPLPLWNRNAGAITAADVARSDAERGVARAEAQVSADLAVAQAALDEASARWRRYRDELRRRSDDIRRSVSLAYQKGGASLLDLLEAQRNDNDVRLATMQAASDAIVAASDLRAASATIIPEESRP